MCELHMGTTGTAGRQAGKEGSRTDIERRVSYASSMARKRYSWRHGLLFYVGVQAASLALNQAAKALAGRRNSDSRKDREFYTREQRLPVFAPPPIAFPVAWTINSVSAIAGGLHVLNLPRGRKGRAQFLQLQAAAWALYSLFQAAYFGLRSPINAELVTVLYSAATVASAQVSLRTLKDPKAAASLATTMVWLALANPVGFSVAAWNYDPFWKVGPIVEPKAGWVKSPR
jgi:tryptophan-rich sensory protein